MKAAMSVEIFQNPAAITKSVLLFSMLIIAVHINDEVTPMPLKSVNKKKGCCGSQQKVLKQILQDFYCWLGTQKKAT